MASQLTKRGTRLVLAADEESAERRGWLSHGLAALGIAALGLAVAASVSLTTSAQTTDTTDPPADLPVAAVPADSAAGPATNPSKRQVAALRAFARRDAAPEGPSRSAALRAAIVKEQAAQRAEELAKAAEKITQAARAATSDARQERLTEADRASRQAAAQLAHEIFAGPSPPGLPRPATGKPPRQRAQHDDPERAHHPDRRRRGLSRSGRGHRRPLRAVRHVVALSHRPGLPSRVRHPHPRGQSRRGALLRQFGRLGRQPRRHPARRRQDHDVLAHVLDGGALRPGRAGRPGDRPRRADRSSLRCSPALRAVPGRSEVRRRLQGHQSLPWLSANGVQTR